MDMKPLVERIRRTPRCIIYPSAGLPTVQDEHVLPDDLCQFYQLCGGAVLFAGSGLSVQILPPAHVVLANPVIVEGLTKESHPEVADDISWSCYLLVQITGANFISIDFHPDRLGRCYESFAFTHAVPGDSRIIALSFTDLLTDLLKNEGREYWTEPDFPYLGDAYD